MLIFIIKKRMLYYRGDYTSMNAYLNSLYLIKIFRDLDTLQCCIIMDDKMTTNCIKI